MNGEILTVTLNSKQIREALIEWAQGRTNIAGTEGTVFDVRGIEDGQVAQVVARKKRVRKAIQRSETT